MNEIGRKEDEPIRDGHSTTENDEPPIMKANIVSRLLFWWLMPLFRKGYSTDLQVYDLYKITKDNSASYLATKLERTWNEELKRSKLQGRQTSLMRALWKMFGAQFMFYFFLAIVEATLAVVEPILLVRIISYFAIIPAISSREAYIYCAVFGLIVAFRQLLIFHQYRHGGSVQGMQIRVATSAVIYRKALRLNGVSMGQTTTGQMVNILSNDVLRFDMGTIYLPYLFISPIQLAAVIWLLWAELGVYALLALVPFCFVVPFQVYSGELFSKFREKTALLTDERVRIMNEIISSMRVVKIYTWDTPFAELVTIARRKEVKKILSTSYLKASTLVIFTTLTSIITAITFVTYSLTGHLLSSSSVFLAIPLLNVVRFNMGLQMPFAIMHGIEARISIQRIQKFLTLEELDLETENDIKASDNGAYDNPAMHTNLELQMESKPVPDSIDGEGISVKHLTSSWDIKEDSTTELEDISFSVVPGELLVVIGPVGVGKSSLLMALLGEMPKQTGNVSLHGKIGYTSQIPWVFSGTLRNNILFGQPFDKSRYESVIKYCALEQDLKQLPQSDLTLVGERGVTLSGGQRARVGLARAVYSNADVYLLDDPLSAVDTSVGKHLFEKCICGILADKTRILVTHQLQYLHSADKIICMNKGKATIGTYKELADSGIDFTTLLKERKKEEAADDIQDLRQRSDSIISRISNVSLQSEVGNEDIGQVSGEEKATGRIGVSVYIRLFRAGAGVVFFIVFMTLNLAAQASVNFSDWWLAQWTYTDERTSAFQDMINGQNTTALPTTPPMNDFDSMNYAWIYCCLVVARLLFNYGRLVMVYFVVVNASKHLHNKMFAAIIRAPMLFFETNPVGRILNRFAKDTGIIDELLPRAVADFNNIFFKLIGVILFISVLNPLVLVFTIPLVVVFLLVRMYYLETARDIKRLDGITRSPVFSHLSATLQGLHTIRAYRAQEQFSNIFDKHLDLHTQAWYLFICTNRWLGIIADLLSTIFVIGVAFSCVLAADLFSLDSSTVGVSLAYSLTLLASAQWCVRQSAEVENLMTSAERVVEYADIKPEAPFQTNVNPADDWPHSGRISMEDVSLRYSQDGPDVLRKISCSIESNEKVGIVGRTGAGKSSLTVALLRLAEPSGSITIDDVDITKIGLHPLRSKLSFIPQDPTLFSGTLRKNLDPFAEHTDNDIWRALDEVQLKTEIEDLELGLETKMAEGGTNFSVGQRQLMCLARAMLRRNKILIVDEATANVDLRTDELIQTTIRRQFKKCTVLTIAHRLNTVMDSDRIMVFDNGSIAECDTPHRLLQKEDGILMKMVQETGKMESAKLVKMAEENQRQIGADISKESGGLQLSSVNLSRSDISHGSDSA